MWPLSERERGEGREREGERQTDRRTDGQTDGERQIERQTDRQIETDRQTDRRRQINRQRDRQRYREVFQSSIVFLSRTQCHDRQPVSPQSLILLFPKPEIDPSSVTMFQTTPWE